MARDALFLPADSYNPEDARLQLAGLIMPVDELTVRAGVFPGNRNARSLGVVAYSPPDLAVQVSPGRGVIQGGEDGLQGAYLWATTWQRIDLAAADPAHDRIDLIGVQVKDSAYGATTDNSSTAVAVTGTPATSPAVPTAPNNFLRLAQVLVPAGATSVNTAQITDLRMYTVAAGGVLPVRAGQYPGPNPAEGLLVYDLDQDAYYYLDNTGGTAAWKRLVTSGTAGLAGHCVGPVPPAAATITTWEHAGTTVLTTGSTGLFSISLPSAYPNGIVTVILSPGDTAGNLGSLVAINANHTYSSIGGIALTRTGSPLVSTSIRVNWLTKGW